ncbi:DUF3606 domain-containing protein [Mesorhizobium sp. ASY16-5R]|uniref:DUF3606 domain-containing protein n=1 Tax=Mesorhizobium sp. ASY16-5R TaxID=3445772 RepID=UPI003FA043E7
MADDKSKTGNRDRKFVAGGQPYEVDYLAKEAGISAEQAKALIERYGNDRKKLLRHAENLRG